MNKYLVLVLLFLALLGYFQYRLGDQMSIKIAFDQLKEKPRKDIDTQLLNG